jgi:hypothetical protein
LIRPQLIEAMPGIDRPDLLQLRKGLDADLREVARRARPEILQLGNGSLLHAAELGGKPLRKRDRAWRYG